MVCDLKAGSRANQSQSQPQCKVSQSDIPVKHDITHSHDLPLGHGDKHTLLPSKPTVTTNTNVPIQDPVYSTSPFMGERHGKLYHYSPQDLCDEVVHHALPSNPYQVGPPPAKDSMDNEEPPSNHTKTKESSPGMPPIQDTLQPHPQSSHILEPEDSDSEDSQSLYPDDSVNDDTKFEDSLNELTQSTSIEESILRIGDSDPFDDMSSHDDGSVPTLSECNLFDDNSSPTDRFQDIIELGQSKIFDSPLVKDFVLTLGKCNIFDDPPSDDSCTDLILGEYNIFTKEPPSPNDADNFTHCPIEYKILDSSQHEENPAPQLGKPVPFPAEDISTLSETLIPPPKSGYPSLMDASTVAAPAMPFDPMNPIFPQQSIACDSFSKQFAVNITSCGDVDSSTVGPRIHTPLDY